MDLRIEKLSNLLVNYSTHVEPGEKVLIHYEGIETIPLVKALIKDVYKSGGLPYTLNKDSSILREILLGATEEQIEFMCDCDLKQMKGMDAYIAIRGASNNSELSDVPAEQISMYDRLASCFEGGVTGDC